MEYALRFLIRGEEKEKDGSRESTFKEKHISNRGSLNCFLQILNTKQKNKTKQKKDRFFSPSSAPITNEITIIRQGGTDRFTGASSPILQKSPPFL